jgi:hypothetical protein
MANRTGTTTKPDDAAAKTRVEALDDRPAQQVEPAGNGKGALVKTEATSNGRGDSDRYARGIKIAQHLATLRFENETEIECMSLLDQAQRQTDEHQPVDVAVVRKLKTLTDSWAVQRGLDGDGGS